MVWVSEDADTLLAVRCVRDSLSLTKGLHTLAQLAPSHP
jgi:hypothetical protein